MYEFQTQQQRMKQDTIQIQKDKEIQHPHQKIVAAVVAFIDENITESLSLSDVAKHVFLNKSYLCRLFKAQTGTTIKKHLTARRVALAKQKLQEGYTVSQVCDLSGFQDYSNFVRAFHQLVGTTPKKYLTST